jgi:hypothetical protein
MVSGGKKFSEKHGPGAAPHPAIEEAVRNRAKNAAMPCAVAFDIAAELNAAPLDVGRTVDLMEFRLVKCQMGLFGYADKGKIVSADEPVPESLRTAIEAAAPERRLTCRTAWDIAARLGIPKLRVGGACEALGVKLRSCQLGAF